MTLTTITIFASGMLTGACTFVIILSLCKTHGRSSLEGEILELREIANRQQRMIETLNDQLKNYKELS